MDQGISIALIGALGTLLGVAGTMIGQRWKMRAESASQDTDRLIAYYTAELAYCRQRCEKWERLALQNLHGMEAAAEVIQTQKTGGSS